MVLIKVSNFPTFLATTNSPSSLMCWVHLLSMNFMPSLQRGQKIIFDLYRKFHSPLILFTLVPLLFPFLLSLPIFQLDTDSYHFNIFF